MSTIVPPTSDTAQPPRCKCGHDEPAHGPSQHPVTTNGASHCRFIACGWIACGCMSWRPAETAR